MILIKLSKNLRIKFPSNRKCSNAAVVVVARALVDVWEETKCTNIENNNNYDDAQLLNLLFVYSLYAINQLINN